MFTTTTAQLGNLRARTCNVSARFDVDSCVLAARRVSTTNSTETDRQTYFNRFRTRS